MKSSAFVPSCIQSSKGFFPSSQILDNNIANYRVYERFSRQIEMSGNNDIHSSSLVFSFSSAKLYLSALPELKDLVISNQAVLEGGLIIDGHPLLKSIVINSNALNTGTTEEFGIFHCPSLSLIIIGSNCLNAITSFSIAGNSIIRILLYRL